MTLQPWQLFGSLLSSTQLPLQLARPVEQVQSPALQVALAPQACVHEPQYLGSLLRSTQLPLHMLKPAGHWHWPATQDAPDEQLVTQLPQCWVSRERSMQLAVPQLSHMALSLAPVATPASVVRGKPLIQSRTHSSRLDAMGEPPGGMASPQPVGKCPFIFSRNNEASGFPGTTNVCSAQLDAGTETSKGARSARVRSSAAAAPFPA